MADINKTLDELTKPEAQYFCTEGGTRTGYMFFDLSDNRRVRPGLQRRLAVEDNPAAAERLERLANWRSGPDGVI